MSVPSQGRRFTFTINNPDVEGASLLSHLQELDHFRFCVFQLEEGTVEHTQHFQGYIEFTKPKRLRAVSTGIPRAHIEIARASCADNVTYCTKEPRLDGPWTAGTSGEATQGLRSDLERGVALVKEGGIKRLREEDPTLYVRFTRGFESLARAQILPPRETPPGVILLYGPTGCGKTRFFYDNAPLEASFRMPLTSGFWFDGYEQHTHVLLDDFVGAASHISLSHLLQLLDRYPLRVPVKGSFADWRPELIFITTNIHPSKWYDYTGREEQLIALARRFTGLVAWRRDFTFLQLLDFDAITEFFQHSLQPRGGFRDTDGSFKVENVVDPYAFY